MNDLFPLLTPPNVDYFSSPGDRDIKATKEELKYVQNILGCTYPEDNQDAWYILNKDVEWHQDGEGACFVYCAEGSGTLVTENYEKHLNQYNCCVFNDRLLHKFTIETPVVKLFVVNIRGKVNNAVTSSSLFITKNKKET